MVVENIKQNDRPIKIDKGLTEQGIYGDYSNAWFDITSAYQYLYLYSKEKEIPLSPDDETEIKKTLMGERSSYKKYIHDKHPEFEEQIMQKSNKYTVSALDNLANSYNNMRKSISKDLNFPLALKYVNLAVFLIRGKEIK